MKFLILTCLAAMLCPPDGDHKALTECSVDCAHWYLEDLHDCRKECR